MSIVTQQDRQRAAERAREWKLFRYTFLFSQDHLAAALGCSRRTVASVENGTESINPSFDTLKRFRALKIKHEREAAEHAQITARLPTYAANFYQRRA